MSPVAAALDALFDQVRYTLDELEATAGAAARLPEGMAEAVPPTGEPSAADLLKGLAGRDRARAASLGADAAETPEATDDGDDSFARVVGAVAAARRALLAAAAAAAEDAARPVLEQTVDDDRETLRAVAYRLHEAGVGR